MFINDPVLIKKNASKYLTKWEVNYEKAFIYLFYFITNAATNYIPNTTSYKNCIMKITQWISVFVFTEKVLFDI